MSRTLFHVALAVALACPGPYAAASVSHDVLQQTQGAAQGAVHDPDWPCIQRKVPELSVAAVWSGPAADLALEEWRSSDVAGTARRIASRRLTVEDAGAAIADYAGGIEEAEKAEKLTLLFAGIFQVLNSERSEVMEGIERYARKQKQIAERIRQDQERLSQLQQADPNSAESAAMNEQLLLEVRVFNERRTSLTYVCEVPVLIEQRVFALARVIQNELPK